jgi:peptidoglycan/LPS O-acetylase OafA/YrhL
MFNKVKVMDYDEYRDTKHFSGLDALRCFSVLGVVWHHTGNKITSMGLPILDRGYLGVSMFFVISGYLITTLLLREFRVHQKIDYKRFMARRALRIFPLYYAVLGIYVVLVYFLESNSLAGQQFWGNLPYYLTYTSNFFVPLTDGRVIFYFAWSLATEEQFYLFWPVLLASLRPRLAAYAMALLTLFIAFNVEFSFTQNVFVRNIPLAICVGAMLAILLDTRGGFNGFRKVVGYSYSPLLMIVLLFAALNSAFFMPIIIVTLMALLLVSLLINARCQTSNLLSSQWILFVGKVSYGIYLLHQLCANLVRKLLELLSIEPSAFLQFSLTSLIAVMSATASYFLFERYFLRLKSRYSV